MDKLQKISSQNVACRCQQPSTDDSEKTRSHWYKEMYCHIHKPPEHKKDNLDVILVKLPLTPSRYRGNHQQRDIPANPYKPTYTFPDEFNGDLERMEDYIRKTAGQKVDNDRKTFSSSPIRIPTTNHNDYPTNNTKRNPEKITRFSDQLTFSNTSPTIERAKPINVTTASPVTVNSRSNTTHPVQSTSTTSTDDEQKSTYKRVLRGGDIPTAGLQKYIPPNREKAFEQLNESNKQESRTNEFQPIYTAVALYNFQAQSNRELSFKKGETILVKRRVNDDWLEGEHHGLTGIFPLNYVELFPYESNEHDNENGNGEGIVKYDYNPQTSLELQLKKGEKVILLRKLDANWYEGRVNHIEGIFPGDYVEIITEPKDNLSKQTENPTNISKIPKSVLKNSTGSKNISDFTVPMQKCQVLYDYTPQNVDELEIHVGDIINILEKCDDGWYCGIMENCIHGNNMKFGTFPGNYVQILPS